MPLPVLPQQPSIRSAGPARSGTKILLFDGYVDEPANFGVPPYLSPHARYVAGAAKAADPACEVRYVTVDEWRAGKKRELLAWCDLLVVIAGALVPGKYLRGTPLSFREAQEVVDAAGRAESVIAGSTALYGFGRGGGLAPAGRAELDRVFTYRARLHADALVHDILTGAVTDRSVGGNRKRTFDEWRDWSVRGAFVVADHPDHPQPLTAEIDTYHGCVRYVNGGCAFCMEPKEGKPQFRPLEDVLAEVAALARHGVRNFRIGGQACFYSYHAKGLGETPTPEPDPGAIEALLKGIHAAVPELHTLHLDNVDPAVVAANPEASEEVTKLVVRYMTDGNIAAFGLESADPRVKEANNLNADAETVLRAAEIIHRHGHLRGANGFPSFLPGLNFIAGLPGEGDDTYEINKRFLREYVARGLWARRINIRKVVMNGEEAQHVDQKRFLDFKEFVRHEIDQPMLKAMFPPGTVLRRVFMEQRDGKTTFGRPIGTYAMLVGVPYEVPLNTWQDIAVTDHGYRSLTGVTVPFDINRANLKALEALPGVGKKRAVRLKVKQPFRGVADVEKALDDPAVAQQLAPLLTFR
ncbi:MAG TPA: radical SAM protein [Candidatus Thermoplasmatota archaeon]|nr:radical SAM protein [Candidatus Thermoplasmatota archaeon]